SRTACGMPTARSPPTMPRRWRASPSSRGRWRARTRSITMSYRNDLGLAVSGAGVESFGHYREALRGLQCFIGDPVAALDRALACDPGFVMAHVLKGYLH